MSKLLAHDNASALLARLPTASTRKRLRKTRSLLQYCSTVIIQRKMRDGHVPKSKYFCRREDASYKPAGSKSIFDEIKEMKDRISSLEAQLAAAVNLLNNQAATNQV